MSPAGAGAITPAPGASSGSNAVLVGTDASGEPGEVLDDCLNVACAGGGYVRALKVQRAGRSIMTPGELLRGFRIPKGTVLT